MSDQNSSGRMIRTKVRLKMIIQGRNYGYLLAVIVGLITVVIYLPALQNDFVNWDDDWYVLDNSHIRSLNMEIFTWAFGKFYNANWHPLTLLSHAVDYAVWGLRPWGHHLTNILLHGINTLLVMLLVFRLLVAARNAGESTADSPGVLADRTALLTAGTTGLLFSIHPLHVESVAWISERKDLLCAFFYLLSLLSYLKYLGTRRTGRESMTTVLPIVNRHFLSSLIFFLMALMSKPMAVTLPVVLLILDWYPYGRFRIEKKAVIIEKAPLLLLSLLSALLTLMAQHSGKAILDLAAVPLGSRALVGLNALISYLAKMLWPVKLSPFYPYPMEISILYFDYLVPALLVGGITAAVLSVSKKQKIWTAVWSYYLITLLPVLGFIQVGNQSMADRYTYLPSIGPLLLMALGCAWVYDKVQNNISKRKLLVSLCFSFMAAGLLSMVYVTESQIRIWKSSIALWSHVIEVASGHGNTLYRNMGIAFNNRGNAFEKHGLLEYALRDYERALLENPFASEPHNNLGNLYLQQGRIDDSLREFQIALEFKPDLAEAHYNLGIIHLRQGSMDDALREFRMSLQKGPDNAETHYHIANIYSAQGRPGDAVKEYQAVIKLRPYFAEAYYNLGNAYSDLRRFYDAIREYQKALQLKPDFVEARLNLGTAFLEADRVDVAVREYQEAVRLKPDSAEAHYNLGIAYSAMGRASEAAMEYEAAFRLKPDPADSKAHKKKQKK